jgi:hypothetical protein
MESNAAARGNVLPIVQIIAAGQAFERLLRILPCLVLF